MLYGFNVINIRIKQTKIQNKIILIHRVPDFTPNQNY